MLQNAGMTQGNGQSSGLQNLQIFGPKSSGSQGNQQNLQTSSSSTGLHPQQALQSPALTSAGTCHEAGQQQQLALLPMHNPSSSTNGLANPSQPAQNPGGQSQTFQMELPEPGANDLMEEVDKSTQLVTEALDAKKNKPKAKATPKAKAAVAKAATKAMAKSKAKAKAQPKAKSMVKPDREHYRSMSNSQRLRLRPTGCGKCRWKPGCTPSCFA